MKTTLYKKHTDVYQALTEAIEENLSNRQMFLPSETELARQLATSRMTLRKALTRAEENGLIRRENKKTVIVHPAPNLRQCGRILFIATGHHSSIFHSAVERLWQRISAEVRLHNGDAALEIFASERPFDLAADTARLGAAVERAGVVLLGPLDARVFMFGDGLKVLRRKSRGKIVFELFPNASPLSENRITLDNRRVGELAAELLRDAGAKRPLLAVDYPKSLTHSPRVEGFLARHADFSAEKPLVLANDEGHSSPAFCMYLASRIEQAHADGHDGAFLVSDENCDVALVHMFAKGFIPEQFKVVTVHGSGLALRHRPPLSCISHGTASVAAAMLAELVNIAEGGFSGPVHRMVEPKVYFNRTL